MPYPKALNWCLGQLDFGQLNLAGIVQLFSGTFLIAFEIAMPIIVVVLLADAVMGIISRSVPQINLLNAQSAP
jgi:flagellar biosynthesis protein FliR